MRSNRVRRGVLLVVASLTLVLVAWGGIAAAQTEDPTYPTVPTTPTSVGGTSVSRGGTADPGSLPFTGGDIALATALGLVAVGAGVAIVLIARRRSTSAHA
jgi:hypothetical protein